MTMMTTTVQVIPPLTAVAIKRSKRWVSHWLPRQGAGRRALADAADRVHLAADWATNLVSPQRRLTRPPPPRHKNGPVTADGAGVGAGKCEPEKTLYCASAVYHCAPPQIAPRAPRASRTGLLAQAVAALIPPPSKVRRPRHALRPAADPGHPRGRLRHRRPPASAMPGPVRRELRFCGKTLPAARGTAHPVIDRRPVAPSQR